MYISSFKNCIQPHTYSFEIRIIYISPGNDPIVLVAPSVCTIIMAGRNVADDVDPDSVIFRSLQLSRHPLQHLARVV